ncbi:MAG: hypothetical protein F2667_07440, partial [Actinobacteria bacterium]|nr:hypothetical protein [Actinomycetota bacterium]
MRVLLLLPTAALMVATLPGVVDGPAPAAASPVLARVSPPDRARVAEPDDLALYRDPVSYRGRTKAPAVRALVGRTTDLSPTGENPDVYVDEAGTSHIVWNEPRGDQPDETIYCRLPRGASACSTTATLRFDKTYGAGDDPSFNTDYDGPKIVRIGDALLALSYRFPTIARGPDGRDGSVSVGWASYDGGTTWDAPVILGRRPLGELAVAGPSDDPVVVNVGTAPYCFDDERPGQMCVSAIRSGLFDGSSGSLSPRAGVDYSGTVVADGTSAVAAMTDAGINSASQSSIWLRRWSGVDPVSDPDNWDLSAPFPGDAPDLASGPRGVYLLANEWTSSGVPGDLQVRSVTHRGAGMAPELGPATRVAGDFANDGQVFEDPAGGLHIAYIESGAVHLRTTMPEDVPSPAAALLPAVTLSTRVGLSNSIALGATADGGGVMAHSDDDGVEVVGFGSTAPTGVPGLADLPGGGNLSCTTIGFGSFEVRALQGCFFRGTGANKRLVVTRGAISLNGLEIVPDAGSQLVLDPDLLRLDTIGTARVLARNDSAEIELFHGRIQRDLAGLRPGDRIFEFPRESFQAEVLGFPVASGLPVELTAGGDARGSRRAGGGIRIPFDVGLPAEFGGFTGAGVLRLEDGRGLVLDSLRIHVGPVGFGVLTFEATVDWVAGGTWTGDGTLQLPAGKIAAHVAFIEGDFDNASISYDPNPPVPIGQFVYLTQVRGGFKVRPETTFSAGVKIGAGLPVQGVQPVTADGEAMMIFPRSGPASFQLHGSVELLGIGLAQSTFRFDTDGYASYDGSTTLDLGAVSGSASFSGFIDATQGLFGAQLTAGGQACGSFSDANGQPEATQRCSKGGLQAAVSNVGFAACAGLETPVGPATIGIEQKWEDLEPLVLASPPLLTFALISAVAFPCDTGEFIIPPPRRLQGHGRVARAIAAGGTAYDLPAGLPTATVRLDGVGPGGAEVSVTAPDGTEVFGPDAAPGASTAVRVPG